MAKYDFDAVLVAVKAAYNLVNKNDAAAKAAHDREAYKLLQEPVKEVTDFFEKYDSFLSKVRPEAQKFVDDMTAAMKKGGKAVNIQDFQKKRDAIAELSARVSSYQDVIKKEFTGGWRGSWPVSFEGYVFDTAPLKRILELRKQQIDRQTSVWNPLSERVQNYLSRADSLLAAAKANKDAGSRDAVALAALKKAYADCLAAGPKGVDAYLAQMKNIQKYETEAKATVDPKTAAKLWEAKGPQLAQFRLYGKTFNGAEKTLKLIQANLAKARKVASPQSQAEFDAFDRTLNAKLAELKAGIAAHGKALKAVDTITAKYEKALGKKLR